jgi:hypothetical protein
LNQDFRHPQDQTAGTTGAIGRSMPLTFSVVVLVFTCVPHQSLPRLHVARELQSSGQSGINADL